MGRIQTLTSSTTTSSMNIDPRSSSWNSLGPTFHESKRNRHHLDDDSNGHVIGSPPPAGPPKVLWNDNFKGELSKANPQDDERAYVPMESESMDTSELSSRVQNIRLQPLQPMIICETVEDDKNDSNEMACSDAVSLSVPPVDVTNEKKRPPMSAPF